MISDLRIRNFKCFEELDLSLAPLTLLSGVNNMGKSTALQALLLLSQSEREGQLERGRLALNGDLVRLGSVDATLPEDVGADAALELALEWSDGCEASFRFASGAGEFTQVERGGADRGAYKERAPFQHTRYVSADRIGPRAAFPTSDATVRGSRDVGPQGEYAPHFLAARGGESIAIQGLHSAHADSIKIRHEVDAWLSMLSPGVQVHTHLHEGLEVVEFGFTFPGKDGRTSEQRSTHVGFGLTYVLPILVAILSAEPGDLVMIENPEAHLHPRAQREIVALFARAAAAQVQVLVETHSDHVLNGMRLAVKNGVLAPDQARVHFFAKNPDTGRRDRISPTIHPDGSIRDWPTGFFDEWDVALDELLAR